MAQLPLSMGWIAASTALRQGRETCVVIASRQKASGRGQAIQLIPKPPVSCLLRSL